MAVESSGNPAIPIVFIALCIAVGIYLIIFNKKKAAAMKEYSAKRGLMYKQKDDGQIENELSEKLDIDEEGKCRAFSHVGNIITDGVVTLLTCLEFLDLARHRRAASPQVRRVAVTFDVTVDASLFFLYDPKNRSSKSRYPANKNLEADSYFQKIIPVIETSPPPHFLTITLSRGKAFIYLEPMVLGSEKESDFDYLLDLGKKLKNSLAT
ncbi:hypothetical protein ACFL1E_00660 [Candidatus Omnitrophota bacterium]